MIECHENEDGSLLITWDKDDPIESQLNTWTEDDFIRAIEECIKVTEKSKIFYNIWCCAYQRRTLYKGTEREHREHETVRMCLEMKDVKFYQFDTEKNRPEGIG